MQIEDPVQPVARNLQPTHLLGTLLSPNLHLITTIFLVYVSKFLFCYKPVFANCLISFFC